MPYRPVHPFIGGKNAEHVKLSMIDWRKSGEAALKKRLQAQSEGELQRDSSRLI